MNMQSFSTTVFIKSTMVLPSDLMIMMTTFILLMTSLSILHLGFSYNTSNSLTICGSSSVFCLNKINLKNIIGVTAFIWFSRSINPSVHSVCCHQVDFPLSALSHTHSSSKTRYSINTYACIVCTYIRSVICVPRNTFTHTELNTLACCITAP